MVGYTQIRVPLHGHTAEQRFGSVPALVVTLGQDSVIVWVLAGGTAQLGLNDTPLGLYLRIAHARSRRDGCYLFHGRLPHGRPPREVFAEVGVDGSCAMNARLSAVLTVGMLPAVCHAEILKPAHGMQPQVDLRRGERSVREVAPSQISADKRADYSAVE